MAASSTSAASGETPSSSNQDTANPNAIVNRFVKKYKSTGLPPLNIPGFRARFNIYDSDNDDSLDANELLKWMRDLNKDPKDAPTVACAEELIRTHDKDGDHKLQFKELQEWIVQGGTKLSKRKRNKLRKKNDVFRHAINFLENVIQDADKNSSLWTFRAGILKITGMTKKDNGKKSCFVVFSVDSTEIARSETVTGKVNPTFKGKNDIAGEVTLVRPCLQGDPSNAPWRGSTLSIRVLSDERPGEALATATLSGKALVDMISHTPPAKAKDGWRPKPVFVALIGASSKSAKIRCWVWVQKAKELYPTAKPTSASATMLGDVLMKQAVSLGKERKKRKETARQNAVAEKDRKLKAKLDQQQKKKEDIAKRRQTRYLKQLEEEQRELSEAKRQQQEEEGGG